MLILETPSARAAWALNLPDKACDVGAASTAYLACRAKSRDMKMAARKLIGV
jgi:hypothetical protein